jgi:nucleotide-binding universal stress UspA family protein
MAIKDILVHLDTSETCNQCVKAAVALAQRKGAHLIGLAFALESSLLQYYGGKLALEVGDSHAQATHKAAVAAIEVFNECTKGAGITTESRIIECSTMELSEKIAFQSRHVDLTFLEQPSPDRANRNLMSALMEGVLFNSGRPVYIVPYIGRRDTPAHKAVIAWDGGFKSARTVNDAIPLLQERGETVVLIIDHEKRKKSHGPNPGADIAAHLERHGVNTTIVKYPSGDYGVSTTILNFVSDAGADLLVMGAYGHSRLRERTFGGVTRTILDQMTVPVLMSN